MNHAVSIFFLLGIIPDKNHGINIDIINNLFMAATNIFDIFTHFWFVERRNRFFYQVFFHLY